MGAGSDIGDWLRQLDLAQYEEVFRDNAVDLETLPELDEGDLEKLGVLLGHRKKILRAIGPLAMPAVVVSPATMPNALLRREGAERRQLTILFCDIVASTALSTRLDPEDLREILAAYTARASQVIERFGGFIARFLGDGVLAYFGYPRAQEHDPEQALRAGLALVEGISRLETAGSRLQVRIGVATGLVVVGDLVDGVGQEHEVIGETPNLAARLQELAEPNSVVVAAHTRQLVGDLFDFRDLGIRSLKGFTEPAQVWRLLGERALGSRFEALRTAALTPLVGREEELAVLTRRWQQVKSGEGQIVLLSGEPGIGKSRVMAAFEEESLAGEAHLRLRLFCSPHHQSSTFYPMIAHLERAAGFARSDTPAAKLDKLTILLSLSGEASTETIALLAELMDLPSDAQSSIAALDPPKKRELTLTAMLRQLESQAQQKPVYLTVEDVHWMDATSLELIDMIAARVPCLPVLLCITYRPEFQPPWTGQAHVTTLALNRLYQRDAAKIVSQVAGDKSLPSEIVDRITERADGIPLFIEELTKALLEGGLLREQDGGFVLDAPLQSLAIPSSLHASLMARLDRLSPVKEVAQIGAALGRSFSYDLLSAVTRRSDGELHGALARLAEAGLVIQRGTEPNAVITFKHALVQDAAYASLLRRPRQELHARIGQTLEERFPETVAAQPELLAHHYTQAGVIEPAINYWRKAGERALRRSAHVEGVSHLRRAIELVGSLPGDGRVRRELDLHLALGQMMRATKGYAAPETLRVFVRARELFDESGTVNDRNAVLYGLWSVHYVRAEHAAAREVAERSLAFAAEHADSDTAATANLLMACSLLAMGEFGESRRRFIRTQELSFSDTDANLSRFTQNHGLAAMSMLPWVLWSLGYPDQAAATAKEAVLLARTRGHVPLIAYVLFVTAFLGTALGAGEELASLAHDAEAYCVDHSVIAYREWARFCRGIVVSQSEDPREGISIMRQAMTAAQELHATFLRPVHLALLASALAKTDVDSALDLVDEAIRTAEDSGERFFTAELHRLRGETLWALGRTGEAEAEFGLALELARHQEARLWELRAATSLARLRREAGQSAEARELLAPVHAWFTEGFDTCDLKEATALLAEL